MDENYVVSLLKNGSECVLIILVGWNEVHSYIRFQRHWKENAGNYDGTGRKNHARD